MPQLLVVEAASKSFQTASSQFRIVKEPTPSPCPGSHTSWHLPISSLVDRVSSSVGSCPMSSAETAAPPSLLTALRETLRLDRAIEVLSPIASLLRRCGSASSFKELQVDRARRLSYLKGVVGGLALHLRQLRRTSHRHPALLRPRGGAPEPAGCLLYRHREGTAHHVPLSPDPCLVYPSVRGHG